MELPSVAAPDAREAQRQRILEAALACFARAGFHGSSMQQICAEAGMSAGNLYRYFPSKEAIIAAIADAERVRNTAIFEELERAADPVEALIALGHRFLDQMAGHRGGAMCAEIMAEALRNPEILTLFERNLAEAHAAVGRALRRGAGMGLVDPDLDIDIVVRMILALADGLVIHRALDPTLRIDTLKAMLERLILRFLRPALPR